MGAFDGRESEVCDFLAIRGPSLMCQKKSGKVIAEAGEGEEIVYADIGEWAEVQGHRRTLNFCRPAGVYGDTEWDSGDDAATV